MLAYDKRVEGTNSAHGRFVDMEHPYSTMDTEYTESIWWAWKKLSEQGFVYEGYKSMQICPRCKPYTFNFEVAQGYKDIADISVTAMFEVLTDNQQPTTDNKTYVLAWTTAPWTLPGNVALAVSPKIEYGMYVREGKNISSHSRAPRRCWVARRTNWSVRYRGRTCRKKYVPPFEEFYNDKELKNHERGWTIYAADFVTDTGRHGDRAHRSCVRHGRHGTRSRERTSIHSACGYGRDDRGSEASFRNAGETERDPQKTDVEVVKFLVHKKVLFAKKKR